MAGENIHAPHFLNLRRLLSSFSESSMKADIGRKVQFPRVLSETSLRPDMVLWSMVSKTVYLVKLSVPWEEGLEALYKRKWTKYADLAVCRMQAGKPPYSLCRGFVGSSTPHLLLNFGCTGAVD